VGKGEKMNSVQGSYQQGMLIGEDQKYILIIEGIELFLPSIPIEATTHVVGATIGEGQPTVTVMEE
jgi:hypothetical protein